MRVVAALGGNALLERGEPPEPDLQRAHIAEAVRALAPLAAEHELVITHGNGPQVGLLARELHAGALLLLTDVAAVQDGYGTGQARPISRATPAQLRSRSFPAGSMRPKIEAVRVVDMTASNAWAEFAALFRRTRQAALEHEQSKGELKALVPEDAREVTGHGVRARRSKSGAITLELSKEEPRDAALQH